MKSPTIRSLVLTSGMFVLSCLCGRAEQPAAKSIELFNGKNLDGWTHVLADPAVPRDKVWSVRDGLIVCLGEPIGVLYTEKSYTSFRLVVEYRWAPGTKPGNSGIMSRMTPNTGALPRTVEVQLQPANAGDLMGLRGLPIAGGQPRWFERDSKLAGKVTGVKRIVGAEKAPGEWNEVEIVAREGAYTVRINGQLVNEASGVEVRAGPVGLQSEGGEIHFRRATLTPL
jgi:hypothetical protein